MNNEFNLDVDSEELFSLESYNEASISKASSCQVQKKDIKKAKIIKREKFSSLEKHSLAKEVEKQRAIWDLGSELHCKADAVNRAWKVISEKMGRSISDCKAEWTALRDSRRYRQKSNKKKKSGDIGGENIENPVLDDSINIDWEYVEDLSFLPDISRKRKTLTTATLKTVTQTNDATEAIDDMLSPASKKSNYSYIERPSQAPSMTNMSDATRIANCIEQLVNSQSLPTVHQQLPLENYSMLANIDRMMQQLPPNKREDLNYEIITLCYKKIKEHNDNCIKE